MDAVTFTRASQGAFVNQNGVLQGMVANLLQFSEQFDNAAWQKTAVTIEVSNEVAPNNELTAYSFIETTASSNHRIFVSSSVTGQIAFSIHVKNNIGSRFVGLRINLTGTTYAHAVFDLANQTYNTSASVTSAAINSVANGWYRIQMSATTSSFGATPMVYLSNVSTVPLESTIAPSYLGDGTSGIFIWGAQLELGWASTEQLANKNLLSYTEQFDNAYWTKSASSVAQDEIGPDGISLAWTLTSTSTSTQPRIERQSLSLTTSIEHTISIYAKAGTTNWIYIQVVSSATPRVWFDLSNCTVGTEQGGAVGAITDEGTGWCRCSITFSADVSDTLGTIRFVMATTNGQTTIPSVGNTIIILQPQFELGDTLTDYQPIAQPTTSTPLAVNPTSNGLLIEEARTNRILWCRDATQANWVSTNITAAKDQTGVDGVANAASSLTATANDGTCIQTITLASGSRTGSVYLKRITGVGNIYVTLDGTTYSAVDLSDTEWRRIVLSGTVTNPTVGIKLAVSGDAVAMDYGQVEDGAFATTPILTTTATATRSGDNVQMGQRIVPLWWISASGTIFSEYFGNLSGTIFAVNSPVRNQQIISTSVVRFYGGRAGIYADLNVGNVNHMHKTAFSFSDTKYEAITSTNSYGTYTVGQISVGHIEFFIGVQFNLTARLCGCIKRIVYFPKYNNKEQIQELVND